MSKKTKIDNTIGMAEEKESLLSRNPFPDECIIEIKQHSSKFLFMHLLPSSNFPLIFSFIHPTDLPQIMWVNKTFREDSRRYIKNLTSYQKISISQEITQSTVETMKKITEDFKEYSAEKRLTFSSDPTILNLKSRPPSSTAHNLNQPGIGHSKAITRNRSP